MKRLSRYTNGYASYTNAFHNCYTYVIRIRVRTLINANTKRNALKVKLEIRSFLTSGQKQSVEKKG